MATDQSERPSLKDAETSSTDPHVAFRMAASSADVASRTMGHSRFSKLHDLGRNPSSKRADLAPDQLRQRLLQILTSSEPRMERRSADYQTRRRKPRKKWPLGATQRDKWPFLDRDWNQLVVQAPQELSDDLGIVFKQMNMIVAIDLISLTSGLGSASDDEATIFENGTLTYLEETVITADLPADDLFDEMFPPPTAVERAEQFLDDYWDIVHLAVWVDFALVGLEAMLGAAGVTGFVGTLAGLSASALLGLEIVAVALLGALVAWLVFLVRKRKQRKKDKESRGGENGNNSGDGGDEISGPINPDPRPRGAPGALTRWCWPFCGNVVFDDGRAEFTIEELSTHLAIVVSSLEIPRDIEVTQSDLELLADLALTMTRPWARRP